MDFPLEEVSDRAYANTDGTGRGNTGGVALDSFAIAIDSSMFPKTGLLLRNGLEHKFGLPVKYLFLTHCHGDHVFGAQSFADVNVVGSRCLKENMELAATENWRPEQIADRRKRMVDQGFLLEGLEITHPDIVFDKRLVIIDGDRRVEIVQTGGHTSCSSYLFYPEEKVLFAGDQLFVGMFPYASDRTCDPDTWIEQLSGYLTMDVEKIVPGHGPVINREEVGVLLECLENFKAATLAAISEGAGPEEIKPPDFDEPKSTRRIDMAREYWHKFYSAQQPS